MSSQNMTILKRAKTPKGPSLGVYDFPEIVVVNREIERFKKTMLQNPSHEEEDSYRAIAERHFLNGLQRARDILILSYCKKS